MVTADKSRRLKKRAEYPESVHLSMQENPVKKQELSRHILILRHLFKKKMLSPCLSPP